MRAILALLLALPLAAEEGAYVVLKTGERFASQERAAQVLSEFGGWVAPRVGQAGLAGRITNKPEEAISLVRDGKPLFAIVSPAFYLEHREELGMAVVAQTRRRGLATEKYAVVVAKGAKADLSKVSTSVAAEEKYLRKVVLAGGAAAQAALASSAWVGDDVAAMAEKDPDAPHAVLLDAATTAFFREDPVVWGEVEVAWESDDLPPDAVVVFSWTPADARTKLAAALLAMKEDVRGKAVCGQMQTDGFGAVDDALWSKAQERWAK